MHMKDYEELKEMLCKELEEYANKDDMSAGDLEAIHKLTDTIKNIDKICMLEGDDGYSYGDGDWQARGMYSNRGGYNENGSSYANRRGSHYVRGHYSRADGRGMRGGRGRGYSRDDAKDYMIDQIDDMMEDTDNSKVREALERCKRTLENA